MNDDILDLPDLMDRVQGDVELALELFDIYQDDYQGKRVELGAAVRDGNVVEVRNVAHSLKGASGNISARQMRDSFYQLEEMGKIGELKGAAEILEKVDQDYQALSQRMTALREELK
jgi:two-component system, sensor histidine kinase and response regulator